MKFKNFAVSAFLLLMFLPALACAQSFQAEEVNRQLQDLQRQLNETKSLYMDKIGELEGKIKHLEQQAAVSAVQPAAPPASPSPVQPSRGSLASLPDISLIGDIVGEFGQEMDNSVGVRGVEIALGGYVYPDIRADAVIGFHEHDGHFEADMEEAYISFFNLPGGFGALAGRKLIDFGKINPIHGHHYMFVDEPLVTTMYLGDHGFAGDGVSLNYLFPVPFFLQGSVGYWNVGGHDCDGHHEGLEYSSHAFNARLWSSFPIMDAGELEIGTSYLRAKGGHHNETSPDDIDKVNMYGLDLTYSHAGTGFQRLMLRNELYYFERERFRPASPPGALPVITPRDLNYGRFGLYSLIHYRWTQYWDGGLRYDWLENYGGGNNDVNQAFSAFLTRSLTETTKLRGQAAYHTGDGDWRFYVQALFGIGPHSHPLE